MLLMNPLSYYILHWIVSALAIMVTGYLLPDFKVRNFLVALLVAVAIGLANVTIRPILFFLTLPLTILTFGLFNFVIDGIVLKICGLFMPGFSVKGWGTAILGALILALVGTGLHTLLV